jgi:SAM-dependent methyltransferase
MTATPTIDEARLERFMDQFVRDLGAGATAPLVVLGDKLGLYARARARAGRRRQPRLRPRRVPTAHRHGPRRAAHRRALPHRRGLRLARARPRALRGTERFFRPGYLANLVDAWLPALDGVVEKLEAGAHVADIGCGHGAPTILMARAYPRSTFCGSDYHEASVEAARRAAERAAVADRVSFEVAAAKDFGGAPFDLVCVFDALHDMGDPVGAARHVRSQLAADGTWMVVEPLAGDAVEDNLNPVGRVFYAGSTLLCTPASLSQDVGLALGAQAGEWRLAEVLAEAGSAASGAPRRRRSTWCWRRVRSGAAGLLPGVQREPAHQLPCATAGGRLDEPVADLRLQLAQQAHGQHLPPTPTRRLDARLTLA